MSLGYSVGDNYVIMEGTILPENVTLYQEVINNYLRGISCPVKAVSGMLRITESFTGSYPDIWTDKENPTDIPLYKPALRNFTLATVLDGTSLDVRVSLIHY